MTRPIDLILTRANSENIGARQGSVQDIGSEINARVADLIKTIDQARQLVSAKAAEAAAMAEPFIGKPEAAKFLNMCTKTLEGRLKMKNPPPHYIDGGKLNFLRSELRSWRRQWRSGNPADSDPAE